MARSRRFAAAAAVLLSLVFFGSTAHADLYRFDFASPLGSGHVIYDNSVPDVDPDPDKGRYLGAILSYEVRLDGMRQNETGLPTFETFTGTGGSFLLGLEDDGVGA